MTTSQTSQMGKFNVIRLYDDTPLPSRAHNLDAGLDVCAYGTHSLGPMQTLSVPTGLRIEIPEGLLCWVVPRSGRSLKRPFLQPNSPGLLDPGFQGELFVPQLCYADGPMEIGHGERIAQLVFQELSYLEPNTVKSFEKTTQRGTKGQGSTGA